jgi:hypothetical protein
MFASQDLEYTWGLKLPKCYLWIAKYFYCWKVPEKSIEYMARESLVMEFLQN